MSEGVLVLAGATACGKTDLALELAAAYGAEIVGADSRQIYRGMPIGTAAPAPEQMARVPHHLVGFLDPAQRYSAGRYASDAMLAIRDILKPVFLSLDGATLQKLNARIAVNGEEGRQVAASYLKSKGYVK